MGFLLGGETSEKRKKQMFENVQNLNMIFSTYSMSSEAVDIPGVARVVLTTPKPNPIQSAARGLRTKDIGHDPIIYDFKDQHILFKRSWYKRKNIFKKEGFEIIEQDQKRGTTKTITAKPETTTTSTTTTTMVNRKRLMNELENVRNKDSSMVEKVIKKKKMNF